MRMALWCKIKKCRGQNWSWQQGNWRMFTSEHMYVHTYTATNIGLCTHTHTFNGPFSATTRVSQYQNGKPIWILLKQETVSGSGSSWAICKSAYRSRQTTMPAPHHSVLTGRMPFLLPNQQRQSTDGRQLRPMYIYKNWQPKIYIASGPIYWIGRGIRLHTCTALTHVWDTEGLEASSWNINDNMAVDSQSDLQPAVDIGLFTGCQWVWDRCTWRQFVKTATLPATATLVMTMTKKGTKNIRNLCTNKKVRDWHTTTRTCIQ